MYVPLEVNTQRHPLLTYIDMRVAQRTNGDDPTTDEGRATILAEQLYVLSREISYTQERLKGQSLVELKANDLWKSHPDKPESLKNLARTKGLSKSEVSDLLIWEQTFYPYFESIGLNSEDVWMSLGKTRCRRLTPYLRTLLLPEYETYSKRIQEALGKIKKEEHNNVVMAAAIEAGHRSQTEEGNDIDYNIARSLRSNKSLTPGEKDYLYTWFLANNPDYDETRVLTIKLLHIARAMNTSDMDAGITPESIPDLEILARLIEGREMYSVSFEATQKQLHTLRKRLPRNFKLMIDKEIT